MDRLELAVQAPLMPDFFYNAWTNKHRNTLEEYIMFKVKLKNKLEVEKYIKDNPDVNVHQAYDYYYNSFKNESENKYKAEFDWRFYWADEMIKRNDTETSSNGNRS